MPCVYVCASELLGNDYLLMGFRFTLDNSYARQKSMMA